MDTLNMRLGVGGVAQREVDGVASRRFFEELGSEVLRVTERIETMPSLVSVCMAMSSEVLRVTERIETGEEGGADHLNLIVFRGPARHGAH